MTVNKKEYIAIKTQDGVTKLTRGITVVEMFKGEAPLHVQRIIDLSNKGFYNGIKFHRVIDGFIVQAGCPYGNGTGGSDQDDLKAEFNNIKHVEGVMSMARSNDPDSANSQFFIMLGKNSNLDGQYTVFGKVVSGMKYINMIKKGEGDDGSVAQPDLIEEMYVCDENGLRLSNALENPN
jgi:cyclophilin family peptidyl-prolyl cis-trans isomerase